MTECLYREEDVPDLVKALANVAHLWEEIAVALKLPKPVRAECGRESSLVLKLNSVLYKWIVGGLSMATPPTLKTLKEALEGPLVQRPDIARQLVKKSVTRVSSLPSPAASMKESVLLKYKRNLCLRYSSEFEVPRGDWPPVVNKNFINLALVKPSDVPSRTNYSVPGNPDQELEKKERIEYEQAFEVYTCSERMLVLGCPGSGKTTLVHKVVKDWAQGLVLKGAEFVYLISLRPLTSEHDNKLSSILSSFHFSGESVLQQNIEEVDGKGVCFILDGLDEYLPRSKETSLIYALIDKSYLPEAMVIVTSRPAAASAYLPNKSSFKQIEVFGFSRKDIFEYVDSFPFSKSSNIAEPLKKKLKNFLRSHPGVLDLCYLPVNVAIICFLYNCDSDILPETQTEMYKLFTTSIIIRQLKKSDQSAKLTSLEHLQGEEAECFKELCSVAYEMTVNSRQVLNHGKFSADSQHSLGLVTTDIYAHWSGEYQNQYSFLHLTLQEFLAAYHISKLGPEQQLDVIDQYSGAVHMRNVWKFYFGLAKFGNEGLDGAKKIIQKTSRDDRELFSVLCAYEAKQEAIVELVSSQEFRFLKLRQSYDLSALAYLWSAAACPDNEATPTTQLTVVSEVGSSTFDHLLSQLSDRAINNLKTLEVYSRNIEFGNVDVVTNKLNNAEQGLKLTSGVFKSLKVLSLLFNYIGDDGAKMIAEGLGVNHTLTYLHLCRCGIGASGVNALMKTTCAVEHLDLSLNDIGDEGARAVARRLKNSSSLQVIGLSHCCIGPDGVEALADAIACDTAVYLSWHDNGNDFTLSERSLYLYFLKHENSLIRIYNGNVATSDWLHLDISCNKRISFEDGTGFALLDHFKKLVVLDLSGSYHGPYETMKLVDYVLHKDNCKMLQSLDLSDDFPRDIANRVILKLLNHDKLQQIYFSAEMESPYPTLYLADYEFKYEEVRALARGIQEKQDFNYSQNYYPVLDIDISRTMMTMEESLALLGALKHCNRVRNISFCLMATTIRHQLSQGTRLSSSDMQTLKAELETEVEKAELVKAFKHDSIDREIILRIPGEVVEAILTIACTSFKHRNSHQKH